MSALAELREALVSIDHIMIELEMELADLDGTSEHDIDEPREIEIEKLRRENLGLRETIRRQAERIARLERRSPARDTKPANDDRGLLR